MGGRGAKSSKASGGSGKAMSANELYAKASDKYDVDYETMCKRADFKDRRRTALQSQ
jgi:hypothetical protein